MTGKGFHIYEIGERGFGGQSAEKSCQRGARNRLDLGKSDLIKQFSVI